MEALTPSNSLLQSQWHLLGRSIVISQGGALPRPWRSLPKVAIPEKAENSSDRLIEFLRHAWLNRTPITIELLGSKDHLKSPEVSLAEVYELSHDFYFKREYVHFLVWANSYDATKAEPIWWYQRLATHLGLIPDNEADVLLGGEPIWCDGGPRGDLTFPVLHRETLALGSTSLTHPVRPLEQQLALDQMSATFHRVGPARVLAPAGSGKTRVITARIQSLLKQGVEPDNITTLAYNRRACEELQERLGSRFANSSIRTVHALGFEVLRQFHKVTLATPRQLDSILKHSIKDARWEGTEAELKRIFTQLRVRLQLPKLAPQALQQALISFTIYRQQLRDLDLLDYEEQVYGALELLLRNPRARQWGRRNCRHLLVDEFQDITPCYLLFLRTLCGPSEQLFAVGDDDQVIYGYAGADPGFLIGFKELFSNARSYQLTRNYRCPQGIVRQVQRLLQNNRNRVKKSFRPKSSETASIKIVELPKSDWPKEVHRQVRAWLKHDPQGDIAVLSRVGSLLSPLESIWSEQEESSVTLSTIHRVKGLEWDYVLLYGIDSGILPHARSLDLEEERRLLHVGLTRCRKEVVALCSPEERSPFLDELLSWRDRLVNLYGSMTLLKTCRVSPKHREGSFSKAANSSG